MMRFAISSGSVSALECDDEESEGEDLMSGWTMRLGEYDLMTVDAVGVHMTWDCSCCQSMMSSKDEEGLISQTSHPPASG